ncbi:hypothetical protein IAU59_005553 [Kwoniella sp. CBS 9459]
MSTSTDQFTHVGSEDTTQATTPPTFTADRLKSDFETLSQKQKEFYRVHDESCSGKGAISKIQPRREADRRKIIGDDDYKRRMGEAVFLDVQQVLVSTQVGTSAQPTTESPVSETDTGAGAGTKYQPVLMLASSLMPPSLSPTDSEAWLRDQARLLSHEYRNESMRSASVGSCEPPTLEGLRRATVSSILDSHDAQGPIHDRLQAARKDYAGECSGRTVEEVEAAFRGACYRRNLMDGVPDPSTRRTFVPREDAKSLAEVSIDCTTRAHHLPEAVKLVNSEVSTVREQSDKEREANPKLPENMRQWVTSTQPPKPEAWKKTYEGNQARWEEVTNTVSRALSKLVDQSPKVDGIAIAGDTDLTAAFQRPQSVLNPSAPSEILPAEDQVPGYPSNATADLSNVTLRLYEVPEGDHWDGSVPSLDHLRSLFNTELPSHVDRTAV